jgi:hypothetical protein
MQATEACHRAILLVSMNYNDRVRELFARIRAAQDLEEVEKAGAELRKLLCHVAEDLDGNPGSDGVPSAHAS